MKRPLRLVLEIGSPQTQDQSPTQPPTKPSVDVAWGLLVDARRKVVKALEDGDDVTGQAAATWLGGAIAAVAAIGQESAESIQARLVAEVPTPVAPPAISPPGGGEFVKVDRSTRPARHPGAQRAVDLEELTQEERDELGITLASDDS